MRLGLIGLAFLATACASGGASGTGGFQVPPPDADYGPEPDVETDAKLYFETLLKDPDSARYKLGYVGKAHCNKGTFWGGDVVWNGYAANVYVNGKNSYGGYAGFKPYTLLWKQDGTIGRHISDDDFGNSTWGAGLCRWANGQTEMADK